MKTEVVIIGGGPAGAAAAMFLRREGIAPVIIEATNFPRYHIGESMTGAAGEVMTDLGLAGEMYRRRYPTKQGVTVYGQSSKGTWFVPVMLRDESWALRRADTWQVRRSDFDEMMLNQAVARGAVRLAGRAVRPLTENGSVGGVRVRMADGGTDDIRSEVVLDCSGQATWLAGLRDVTGPKYTGSYDKQIAVFSQVAGAIRDESLDKEVQRDRHRDNTLIFYRGKYHWAWFIPLDDQVVSVGVVIPSAYFVDQGETPDAFLRRELAELHPELARRVAGCPLVEGVHVIPNYSYQVRGFCGRGFLCVGDAHRFVDPIFSFGMTVALREAQFAARAVRAYLDGAHRDRPNPFAEHQQFCEKGIDVLEDALDTFWEHPLAFAWAVHSRYREQMVDMFAGRIYAHEHQPSPALHSFRQLLGRQNERERSYGSESDYSIPIGSRFHPERAALWNVDAPIDTTERWMRPEDLDAPHHVG